MKDQAHYELHSIKRSWNLIRARELVVLRSSAQPGGSVYVGVCDMLFPQLRTEACTAVVSSLAKL